MNITIRKVNTNPYAKFGLRITFGPEVGYGSLFAFSSFHLKFVDQMSALTRVKNLPDDRFCAMRQKLFHTFK